MSPETGTSNESDFLGLTEMYLAEIVTSSRGVVTRDMEHPTKSTTNGSQFVKHVTNMGESGKISIIAEEVQASKRTVKFCMRW